jgi:hypothetical protein
MKKSFARVSLFAFALLMIAAVASAEEYKFKVHNNTKSVIKKILVSQDGKEYGFFDIGSGIKPGATVTLVWDQSTNGEDCEQYVKAVYSDGSESEPATFDFCESDIALEFDE